MRTLIFALLLVQQVGMASELGKKPDLNIITRLVENPHYEGPNCATAALLGLDVLKTPIFLSPKFLRVWVRDSRCARAASPGPGVIAEQNFGSHYYLILDDKLVFQRANSGAPFSIVPKAVAQLPDSHAQTEYFAWTGDASCPAHRFEEFIATRTPTDPLAMAARFLRGHFGLIQKTEAPPFSQLFDQYQSYLEHGKREVFKGEDFTELSMRIFKDTMLAAYERQFNDHINSLVQEEALTTINALMDAAKKAAGPWELKAITHFSESLENRVFYFESFKPDPSPVYNLEWRVDCASLAWSGDIAGLSQRFNECQSELGAKKGNWIELLTERLSLSPEFYIRKHEHLEIYDVHLNGRRIRFSTNLDLLIK